MLRGILLTPVVLATVTTLGWAAGDTSTAELTDALRSHVKYLASDSLEGRLVGSAGIAKAAAHIAGQFHDMGLRPAFGESYFQELPLQFGREVVGQPSLVIGGVTVAYPEDYSVLPISGSGCRTGRAMFAVPTALDPDTYESGLAERFKGLVMVQFVAKEREAGRWTMKGHDGLLDWMYQIASDAQSQGIAGVIFVAGSPEEPNVPVHTFPVQRHTRRLEIPVFETTYAVMERVLRTQAWSLEDAVFKGVGPSQQLAIAMIRLACQVDVTTAGHTIHTSNVAGILRGTARPGQYVVVGAHYDHLGYGDIASSTPWRREIHNGADDNASGVAALIELARGLVSGGPTRCSVVFVAFTAEELGAIGSEYYCKNPPHALDGTLAMINLDTVGRLEDDRLIVFGARSAAEFSRLLDESNRDSSLEIVEKKEIYGFSDQNPFYARGIPSLHFFTGAHDDYHSPDDDWQRLNFDGLAAVTSFVGEFTAAVAGVDALTPAVEPEQPSKPTVSRGKGAFLGIIPDFAYTGTGVGIKGAVLMSPAEQAGLQGGDVIVGIDGTTIADLQGLMRFLVGKTAGDTIEIQVMRSSAAVTRKAVLGVRAPQGQSD